MSHDGSATTRLHEPTDEPAPAPLDEQTRVLMMADFEHWGASLLQNEALGESRLNFLIALVGAVATALALLAKDTGLASLREVAAPAAAAVFSAAAFGGLTLLRLIRRNRTSKKHRDVLKMIRERMAGSAYVKAYEQLLRDSAGLSIQRGGLAVQASVINACLLGAGVWLALGAGSSWTALAVPCAAAGVTMLAQFAMVESAERAALPRVVEANRAPGAGNPPPG